MQYLCSKGNEPLTTLGLDKYSWEFYPDFNRVLKIHQNNYFYLHNFFYGNKYKHIYIRYTYRTILLYSANILQDIFFSHWCVHFNVCNFNLFEMFMLKDRQNRKNIDDLKICLHVSMHWTTKIVVEIVDYPSTNWLHVYCLQWLARLAPNTNLCTQYYVCVPSARFENLIPTSTTTSTTMTTTTTASTTRK